MLVASISVGSFNEFKHVAFGLVQPAELWVCKSLKSGQFKAVWIRPATEWATADRSSRVPEGWVAGATLPSPASSILIESDAI